MKVAPFADIDDVFARELDDDADAGHEVFDRVAFAQATLKLVHPRKMTIALCTGGSRLRVESGRTWGKQDGERWALIAIPKDASKRAIALALAALSDTSAPPYALDVLLARPPSHQRGESPS